MSVEIDYSSLTFCWALKESSFAASYTISYSIKGSDCFRDTVSSVTTAKTAYELTGLEEGIEYFVTVTAPLSGGEFLTSYISATTITACQLIMLYPILLELSH